MVLVALKRGVLLSLLLVACHGRPPSAPAASLAAPAASPVAPTASPAAPAASPVVPARPAATLVRGRAVVAADHVLASKAGVEVLAAGGNAVDAAVAAALASGVVQPSGSGLGGGGFALVVSADGQARFLDFREVAPAATGPRTFVDAPEGASVKGGLAVAVPAEGIGLAELHKRWGRAKIQAVAAPAERLAREGSPMGVHLSMSLASVQMPGLFQEGMRRPGLADALRSWAATRGEAFRTGWVARDMVEAARAAGGVLSREDLAAYTVKERAPLKMAWGQRVVWTAPPPSSGGVALLELLGGAGEGLHCRVEAAKFAMAERAAFGGDPDFVSWDVGAQLDTAHLAKIRSDCGPGTHPPSHYAPPGAGAPVEDHGTLHISVIDAEGMAVALTTTINTSFGSRVVTPRSNIVLNNQMDDFATRPGEPNAFGLVQGTANAVAPGKRPLSSMTPTVVVGPDGRPELAVGASGGPFIITGTAQVLLDVLGEGLDPAAALDRPRWHHQWLPDKVILEPGDPRAEELRAAGHVVDTLPRPYCAVQVARVRVSPDGGRVVEGAADPRKHGEAAALP